MLLKMFIAEATYTMTLKPTMWFLNVNRPRMRNFFPSLSTTAAAVIPQRGKKRDSPNQGKSYLAPEVWRELLYSEASDIYS